MEKTIFETKFDIEMEEVVRGIEQLELQCNNIFGIVDNSTIYTLQQWSFVYFYSYMEYGKNLDTLRGMEKFATDFLMWQNVARPEMMFCVIGEEFETKEFSHNDDFTWNSVMSLIRQVMRRVFIFRPELPETKESYEKRIAKEKVLKERTKQMESILEQRGQYGRG